jgi:hypothetical protein
MELAAPVRTRERLNWPRTVKPSQVGGIHLGTQGTAERLSLERNGKTRWRRTDISTAPRSRTRVETLGGYANAHQVSLLEPLSAGNTGSDRHYSSSSLAPTTSSAASSASSSVRSASAAP